MASTAGWSLSMMVPSPVSSVKPAPEGSLSITVKRSSASCSPSSRDGTKMIRVVSPTGKVSLPATGV